MDFKVWTVCLNLFFYQTIIAQLLPQRNFGYQAASLNPTIGSVNNALVGKNQQLHNHLSVSANQQYLNAPVRNIQLFANNVPVGNIVSLANNVPMGNNVVSGTNVPISTNVPVGNNVLSGNFAHVDRTVPTANIQAFANFLVNNNQQLANSPTVASNKLFTKNLPVVNIQQSPNSLAVANNQLPANNLPNVNTQQLTNRKSVAYNQPFANFPVNNNQQYVNSMEYTNNQLNSNNLVKVCNSQPLVNTLSDTNYKLVNNKPPPGNTQQFANSFSNTNNQRTANIPVNNNDRFSNNLAVKNNQLFTNNPAGNNQQFTSSVSDANSQNFLNNLNSAPVGNNQFFANILPLNNNQPYYADNLPNSINIPIGNGHLNEHYQILTNNLPIDNDNWAMIDQMLRNNFSPNVFLSVTNLPMPVNEYWPVPHDLPNINNLPIVCTIQNSRQPNLIKEFSSNNALDGNTFEAPVLFVNNGGQNSNAFVNVPSFTSTSTDFYSNKNLPINEFIANNVQRVSNKNEFTESYDIAKTLLANQNIPISKSVELNTVVPNNMQFTNNVPFNNLLRYSDEMPISSQITNKYVNRLPMPIPLCEELPLPIVPFNDDFSSHKILSLRNMIENLRVTGNNVQDYRNNYLHSAQSYETPSVNVPLCNTNNDQNIPLTTKQVPKTVLALALKELLENESPKNNLLGSSLPNNDLPTVNLAEFNMPNFNLPVLPVDNTIPNLSLLNLNAPAANPNSKTLFQLGELTNLPIITGLPIIGVTESVTVINTAPSLYL